MEVNITHCIMNFQQCNITALRSHAHLKILEKPKHVVRIFLICLRSIKYEKKTLLFHFVRQNAANIKSIVINLFKTANINLYQYNFHVLH